MTTRVDTRYLETRRKDVLRLAKSLREKDLPETIEAITRPVAVQFKRDMHNGGAKRATVNKTIGSLRQYWKHMLDDGLVDGLSPWMGVTVTKEAQGSENPDIRAYTDAEITKIFNQATKQDIRDSMMFAALTGESPP